MGRKWDWERVNWETFEEAQREIRDELIRTEEALNELVSDGSIPDRLLESIEHLKSAVGGLSFLVQLHHRHVKELEEGPPSS